MASANDEGNEDYDKLLGDYSRLKLIERVETLLRDWIRQAGRGCRCRKVAYASHLRTQHAVIG